MCGVFGAVERFGGGGDNISKIVFTGLFQLQHRGRESAGISVSSGGVISTQKGMGTIDWVFREQVPREDLVQFSLDHNTTKKKIIKYISRQNTFSKDQCSDLYGTKTKRELLTIALDIFEELNTKNPLDGLLGGAAIGHTRYSTTGASGAKNTQPIVVQYQGRDAAIGLNGNVKTELLEEVIKQRGGYERTDTTDTGLIAALIATSRKDSFLDALIETVQILEGAFSLVILYEDKVFAIKDKFGIRPLCIGQTDTHFLVASESCALDNFRAEFLGEVEPGTIVIFTKDSQKVDKFKWTGEGVGKRCVFEDDYFSFPNSLGSNNTRVLLHRISQGREAAREHPIVDADVVVPVLDSGLFHCIGYARELKKIFKDRDIQVIEEALFEGDLFNYGIIRGRVERTFMHPIADVRKLLQNLKFSIVPDIVKDRHVVLVDDSIVRANVMLYLVEELRFFGAKKVSVIIPFPPIRHPCHLGVDFPTREELVAYNKSVEEVREIIGADYLGYLSEEGLFKALNQDKENYCYGCLAGGEAWPVSPPDEASYTPKEK